MMIDDADRHVDQERQPPGDDGSAPPSTRPSTEPMPCIAADTAMRAVARLPDRVCRRDERQPGRRGDRGAGALHSAGDDQRDPVGGQAAHQRGDREHADAGQERALVADRVADAAAEQQQPAEGQHVGGDDPALGRIGQVQIGLHPRQRDDDDGAVERRHQLHAGDRDDRDAEHRRRQRRRWPGQTLRNRPPQTWVASLPSAEFRRALTHAQRDAMPNALKLSLAECRAKALRRRSRP